MNLINLLYLPFTILSIFKPNTWKKNYVELNEKMKLIINEFYLSIRKNLNTEESDLLHFEKLEKLEIQAYYKIGNQLIGNESSFKSNLLKVFYV